jgi:hypothetical protein
VWRGVLSGTPAVGFEDSFGVVCCVDLGHGGGGCCSCDGDQKLGV